MLRKILLSTILMFATVVITAAAELSKAQQSEIWDKANNAYIKGDYKNAAENYEKLRTAGYESSKLYNNLGNTYYKSDEVGKAILNYNRALKLSPANSDIKYNLEIAQMRTVNKIDAVPEVFIITWIRALRQMMSSNGWAISSLILFTITLAGAGTYLLSRTVTGRKICFSIGAVSLVFFIVSFVFAIEQRDIKIYSHEAVVMSGSAVVKSSPDDNGKDVFVLNEGALVSISEELNDWVEIRIASGNKGWIKTSALEKIF